MFKEYNIVYQLMLTPKDHTGRRKNKGEKFEVFHFEEPF